MPPVSAPLKEPVDLVLHIGSGKTGTSSIQHFLQHNRARLAELGCLYPQSPGRARHVRLGLFAMPDERLDGINSWHRQPFDTPEQFRRTFRRKLFREINESGLSRILMSDEALYGLPDRALQRLHRFTDRIARSVRLVVYLRRQDDHLISRYQQVVKVGETRRLSERLRELDVSDTYDYFGRLRTWQDIMDPEQFVVRRFERTSFVDGSLYQDFLDSAGIDVSADGLEQVPNLNESLDAEAVELLRLLNILRVENEGATRGKIPNRSWVERLAGNSPGPALTLPARTLDAFMAQWEDSNRDVARHFLGDPEGQLFLTPRKTTNTTADQRLDPSRIDHYIELLELPESWHAPLRTLAEREARVR